MTPEETADALKGPVLIGVDLGSHSIRTGAIDVDGTVLDFHREPYPASEAAGGRALADRLLESIASMVEAHAGRSLIGAIGVGFPGLVQQQTRRIVNLPHAPSLVHLDLHEEINRAFGLPVHFENNASAAAYAEMCCGVARSAHDWLYLHIGAGVGAGLVLGGQLYHGKSGFAGEIGHINIDPEGINCSCGSIGCLETIASTPNIVRRTRERLKRDRTSSLSRLGAMGGFAYEDIVGAARDGDDLAIMMMERTGRSIGRALAGVINLLNLSLIAIGGMPEARLLLVSAIDAEMRRRAFDEAYADCRVTAAELGPEAGVIGAALLAGKFSA